MEMQDDLTFYFLFFSGLLYVNKTCDLWDKTSQWI